MHDCGKNKECNMYCTYPFVISIKEVFGVQRPRYSTNTLPTMVYGQTFSIIT